MVNNKFCSAGVFIHSENKEDEYLKIIKSGDEDMINTLEMFLEKLDVLNEISAGYKALKEKLKIISGAADDEELSEVLKGI